MPHLFDQFPLQATLMHLAKEESTNARTINHQTMSSPQGSPSPNVHVECQKLSLVSFSSYRMSCALLRAQAFLHIPSIIRPRFTKGFVGNPLGGPGLAKCGQAHDFQKPTSTLAASSFSLWFSEPCGPTALVALR